FSCVHTLKSTPAGIFEGGAGRAATLFCSFGFFFLVSFFFSFVAVFVFGFGSVFALVLPPERRAGSFAAAMIGFTGELATAFAPNTATTALLPASLQTPGRRASPYGNVVFFGPMHAVFHSGYEQ